LRWFIDKNNTHNTCLKELGLPFYWKMAPFFFPGNTVHDTKENARPVASMHDSDFSKHWSWRSVLNLEPSSYHVPSFLANTDNFPSLLDFTLGFNSSFLCLHFNIPHLNSVMMFNEIVKKKKKKECFLIIYILTF